MSSRLYKEIREKRGLAYAIMSDIDLGKNYGYMITWAGTDPKNVKEIKELYKKEYKNMINVTTKELEEAKTQVIGNRKVESEGSSETALNLLSEEIAGKAEEYYKYEEKIKNVTLEEIKEITKNEECTTFILGPQ